MKTIIAIVTLAALTATAQYYGDTTRIGGYTGTRSSDSTKGKSAVIRKALTSIDNPEHKYISLETFKKNCLPQVKQMHAINQQGELVQTDHYKEYNSAIQLQPVKDKTTYRIVQMLPNNMAIITVASGYNNPYIGTKLHETVPDETKFSANLIYLNKTFTYTTVLGAYKTIALAAIAPEPEPATDDVIIKAFQNGRAFDILHTQTYIYECSTCQGTGAVMKQSGTFSLRGLCESCRGKKQHEITLPTVFTVIIK